MHQELEINFTYYHSSNILLFKCRKAMDVSLMFNYATECNQYYHTDISTIILISHSFIPTTSNWITNCNLFNRNANVRRYLPTLPCARLLKVSCLLVSEKWAYLHVHLIACKQYSIQNYGYATCWDTFELDRLKDYGPSSDEVELSW